MSRSFSDLKTAVGNRVGSTDTTFATIIGTYINQRYRDVLRRTNWNAINPDFAMTATSASTVVSASTYKLPSDFGKELYVFNSSSSKNIPHLDLERLDQEYYATLESTGTIESYAIFNTTDTTDASGNPDAARVKKIRFYKAPTTDNPLTIPYTMRPADLSGDTDELALDCETAVEYGATADAWAYKRQSSKAQYFEALYEKAIQSLMWDKGNQPNQIPMMNVAALDRNDGID